VYQAREEGRRGCVALVCRAILPIRAARDRSVCVELPDVRTATDLVAAAATVIERAAAGDMSLSEAREFMGLLEVERRVIETSELAVRIEVLESQASAVRGRAAVAELARRVRRVVLEEEVKR